MSASRWEDSTGRAGGRFEVLATVLTLCGSEAQLSRYPAEWDFKWNTRKVKEADVTAGCRSARVSANRAAFALARLSF